MKHIRSNQASMELITSFVIIVDMKATSQLKPNGKLKGSEAHMTDNPIELMNEFIIKYKQSDYNLSCFTDEELIKYVKVFREILNAFSIVSNKVTDEQYQRGNC
jgi:hypothetical protein